MLSVTRSIAPARFARFALFQALSRGRESMPLSGLLACAQQPDHLEAGPRLELGDLRGDIIAAFGSSDAARTDGFVGPVGPVGPGGPDGSAHGRPLAGPNTRLGATSAAAPSGDSMRAAATVEAGVSGVAAGSRAVTEAEFVDLASYWSAVFDASRSSGGRGAVASTESASASRDTPRIGAPAAVQAVATTAAPGVDAAFRAALASRLSRAFQDTGGEARQTRHAGLAGHAAHAGIAGTSGGEAGRASGRGGSEAMAAVLAGGGRGGRGGQGELGVSHGQGQEPSPRLVQGVHYFTAGGASFAAPTRRVTCPTQPKPPPPPPPAPPSSEDLRDSSAVDAAGAKSNEQQCIAGPTQAPHAPHSLQPARSAQCAPSAPPVPPVPSARLVPSAFEVAAARLGPGLGAERDARVAAAATAGAHRAEVDLGVRVTPPPGPSAPRSTLLPIGGVGASVLERLLLHVTR